jgi:hypothetical protein
MNNMNQEKERKRKKISVFLDGEGRVTQLPARQKSKLLVLEYLAEKFAAGKDYTEKEVNAILTDWHTFNDYFLLRRELIDFKFLFRTRDGSRYWKEPA